MNSDGYDMFFYGNQMSNVQDILSLFDYHEFSDPARNYEKDSFLHDYGGRGVREYRWVFMEINGLKFAVAQQIIGSKEEFEKISTNCQCERCLMWWFNPLKYMPIIDYGCLKDSSYVGWKQEYPHNIEKTRLYIKKNQLDTK